jgi:hypothetical protein
MKEFFGWEGYTREAEGFLSWQHLLFVTCLMAVMTALAILLGRKNKHAIDAVKNRVLIVAAILIDSFELFKIVILCFRSKDPLAWRYELPLFLCSIMLVAIPLAAFSKGRAKEAALDFVCIFGIVGAVFGTIGAGQNYNAYPVLSMDNVVSGLTHSISGFASLYIMFSGMAGLKKSTANLFRGDSKGKTYAVTRDMAKEFAAEAGAVRCRDLKGIETGKVLYSCEDCVRLGCRLIEKYLPEE